MVTKNVQSPEESGRGRLLADRTALPQQVLARACLDIFEILVASALSSHDPALADRLLAWGDEYKPELQRLVRRGR